MTDRDPPRTPTGALAVSEPNKTEPVYITTPGFPPPPDGEWQFILRERHGDEPYVWELLWTDPEGEHWSEDYTNVTEALARVHELFHHGMGGDVYGVRLHARGRQCTSRSRRGISVRGRWER
jgi:hypothetical protein